VRAPLHLSGFVLRGHCCVGRKWDATPAPRERRRVGKHTTGVYSTPDKSAIRHLATAWSVARRRNATVPTRETRSDPLEAGPTVAYAAVKGRFTAVARDEHFPSVGLRGLLD
jgi:hypothetical protein